MRHMTPDESKGRKSQPKEPGGWGGTGIIMPITLGEDTDPYKNL